MCVCVCHSVRIHQTAFPYKVGVSCNILQRPTNSGKCAINTTSNQLPFFTQGAQKLLLLCDTVFP